MSCKQNQRGNSTDYTPRELSVELHVIPKICSPITNQHVKVAKENYEHLSDLELADCTNNCSEVNIDILIGGNLYWKFMSGRIKRGSSGPVALDSILGWVLSGEAARVSSCEFLSSHVLKLDVEVEDRTDFDKEIVRKVKEF